MPNLTPEQQAAIQSYLARQAGQRVDLQGSVAGSVAAARNPQIRGGGELLKGLGAGFAGAPVDIASMAMRPFGLLGNTPQQNVVGSSDWFGRMMGADPSSAPFVAGSIGVPDPTDVAKVAAKFDPATISAIMAGIPVFHGSPHKFEAFDLSKIGTGEGAQAYGHGLYFAENPGVAQSYITAGQAAKGRIDGTDVAHLTRDQSGETARGSINELASYIDSYSSRDAVRTSLKGRRDDLLAMHDELEKAGRLKYPEGSLYHVDIPDEAIEKMLDWDKPLSEQPESVRAALTKLTGPNSPLTGEFARGITPQMTGEDLLKHLGADKEASDMLHAAGIPGIRYLDQGSRNAGGWHITPPTQTVSGKWMVKSSDYNSKGLHFDTEAQAKAALAEKIGGETRNIVLFDDKLAKIVKRE